MIDRALGIAGIAIGIICFALPLVVTVSRSAAQKLLGLGIFLLFVSVATLFVPLHEASNGHPAQVLCTGEHPGNCPGPHDLFLGCPNRSNDAMLAEFCKSMRGQISPIQTEIPGNKCGYSLYRLRCAD